MSKPIVVKDSEETIEIEIKSVILNEIISDILTNKVESLSVVKSSKDATSSKNAVPQEYDNALCDNLLIFGYGSLVWKADFPYLERMGGYIKGFERRFYQNSIDHRGTANKPGRVVTLVPSQDPNAKVWGIAYKIAPQNKESVLQHLDYREKNGYCRHEAKFYKYNFNDEDISDPTDILLYLATVDNESYNDETNLEKIADQIYYAKGISGTNREYVFKLANAMRTHYPGNDDDHLFALETILKNRENKYEEIEKNIVNDISSSIKFALDSGISFDNVSYIIESVTDKFKKGETYNFGQI